MVWQLGTSLQQLNYNYLTGICPPGIVLFILCHAGFLWWSGPSGARDYILWNTRISQQRIYLVSEALRPRKGSGGKKFLCTENVPVCTRTVPVIMTLLLNISPYQSWLCPNQSPNRFYAIRTATSSATSSLDLPCVSELVICD